MAKQPRVWSGTAWEPLAVTLPDLSNYSTTTQMNTAIATASSMTLISSGTYTGASAVNLTNALSNTYKFYLLRIEHYGTATSNGYNNLRFRENTTDKTTGYYFGGFYGDSAGSGGWPASGLGGAASIGFERHGNSIAEGIASTIFITRVDATTGHATVSGYYKHSYRAQQISGMNTSMSNFTGLTWFADNGTITGSYKLYGYN